MWSRWKVLVEGEVEYLVEWVRDITERKEAQESLRLSEEKHRLFIENFNGIAYGATIDNLKPHYFHGLVEESTGYEGRVFTQGDEKWTDLVHPEDLPSLKNVFWEKLYCDGFNETVSRPKISTAVTHKESG